MNHVHACDGHLLYWKKSFGKIVHDVSRRKAIDNLATFLAEMQKPESLQVGRKPVKVPATITASTSPTETCTVDFSGVVEGRNVVTAAGFPTEADLHVYSVCPNPRLLSARLPDGRQVSVWKGPRNFRLPSKIPCRIDLNSNPNAPVYLPV